ncbi:MAG: hypothetical protein AABX71_00190 [Nanoarchaeota archaeon]
MGKQELGFREGMTRIEHEAITSAFENLARGLMGLLFPSLRVRHLDGNRREQRTYQEPSEAQYKH